MKRTVPILWYENAKGARLYPCPDYNGTPPPPEGFIYQHFRNPFELHDSICTDEGQIGYGTTSWPGDLVLALTRPSWVERTRAMLRYGTPGPRLALDAAILRAAGCERCINTLAHRYGLTWGYRKDGPKDRSNTRCEHCQSDEAQSVSRPPLSEPPGDPEAYTPIVSDFVDAILDKEPK